MALVDMKLSKKEKKEELTIGKIDRPNYPYGLSLDLGSESLEKLKISAKDFAVGETVEVMAKAKVKRLSVNQYEGEGKNESMDLQITHLSVKSSDKFEKAFDEAAGKKEG